jgi:hypothetical protein
MYLSLIERYIPVGRSGLPLVAAGKDVGLTTCRLAPLVTVGREVGLGFAFVEATAWEVLIPGGRSETGVIEGLPIERKGTEVVYGLIARLGAVYMMFGSRRSFKKGDTKQRPSVCVCTRN